MIDYGQAKNTLIHFMQEMYFWEKKATKSLMNKEYKDMLKNELSDIFEKFCTPKKTLRTREKSLSVRFPFEYKLETHPIINKEIEGNYVFFYIRENRSGLEILYRYRMLYKNEKWLVDKKEWFNQNKWENHYL